ncbi:MAG: hypothetical protein ABI581_05635 [Sediminibacterium sp.]
MLAIISANDRLNEVFSIGEIIKRGVIMSSRRARELPIIDIGGTNFYLDLRMNQFRDVDNFANSINLDDLYEKPNGGYMFWFDRREKNLFPGTPEEYAANKNAVEVHLPSQQEMDPLGFVWLMEDQGWLNAQDAKLKTEELLGEYNIHESGMVMQRKPTTDNKLLEKKNIQKTKHRRKL